MWFIEHENLSGGKREWIKPGSQRLYGRTRQPDQDAQSGEKHVFLDNKTISRKHMVLKVHDVAPGDGTKLHLQSRLEVTDLSCRQGTTIIGTDGEKMLKSTKQADGTVLDDTMILTGSEYTIKLSASYPPFKVIWQPTILTFAAKDKETKARSIQLHAFDIKTTSDFVYDKTTHVVAQKRNLPKVLQGLVSGAHIITGEYLDAIIQVATSPYGEPGIYLPSKLEEDFEGFWPNEYDFIPPQGLEPVKRDAHMLAPNPARAEIFKGLTFIFLTDTQHSSLHDVVAGGNGKALLFNLELGKTTVDEYVAYVRSVAGEKKRSKAGNGRLPVITVRLGPSFPEEMEGWIANFNLAVDQAMNQRSIAQNEFLDAIVTNNTSSLLQPPEAVVEISPSMSIATGTIEGAREATPTTSAPPPEASSRVVEPAPAPKEEPAKSNTRKRPFRRGLATSRFTGFDDYEPPPKTRKTEEPRSSMPMEDVQESLPVRESFTASQSRSQPATQTARRREPSVEDSIEAADQLNELFPATAAIRRKRAATRAASRSVEPDGQTTTRKPKSQAALALEKLQKAKKKAEPKEIDVKQRLKLRVKEEEERRKADEDNLREQLEGVDISEIRNLVSIKEMDVVPRTDRPQQHTEASGDRWNDEWNGRKNFKKFRRRGAERGFQPQKVIVPFEEVPQKSGFGTGDAYWLEGTQTSSKSDKPKKTKKKDRVQDNDSEPEAGFIRPNSNRNTQRDVINIPDSDSDGGDPFAGGITSQRSIVTRIAETQVGNTQTQTQRSTRKRGPATVAADAPASKKPRVLRRDGSSDEEETGFRFNRRS